MNKNILLVLIPMVFLGFFANSMKAFAVPIQTTVSLNPAYKSEVVGNNVSIDVMIANAANLRVWGFQLFFETNSLHGLDVVEGPFLKSFAGPSGTHFIKLIVNNAYNSTHGLIWAFCALLGSYPQPASGNGVLATVSFRCVGAGDSHMCLEYPEIEYPVKLLDVNSSCISCTATCADVWVAGPNAATLDINVDVGSFYFPGEHVECFVMTTYQGVWVTPTHITAILHNPQGGTTSLTLSSISTGLYKSTFTMPSDATSGTWVIVIEAFYLTDTLQAYGTSFKTCMLSSTLNSKLVHIDDTAALIQTNVGLLKTDVSNLQLSVTAIDGDVATIQTTLGIIQGVVTSIDPLHNIATIKTDVGIIKADVSNIKTNTTPKAADWTTIGLYISMALLVSIAIVLVVLYLYLRARFRSGEISS